MPRPGILCADRQEKKVIRGAIFGAGCSLMMWGGRAYNDVSPLTGYAVWFVGVLLAAFCDRIGTKK